MWCLRVPQEGSNRPLRPSSTNREVYVRFPVVRDVLRGRSPSRRKPIGSVWEGLFDSLILSQLVRTGLKEVEMRLKVGLSTARLNVWKFIDIVLSLFKQTFREQKILRAVPFQVVRLSGCWLLPERIKEAILAWLGDQCLFLRVVYYKEINGITQLTLALSIFWSLNVRHWEYSLHASNWLSALRPFISPRNTAEWALVVAVVDKVHNAGGLRGKNPRVVALENAVVGVYTVIHCFVEQRLLDLALILLRYLVVLCASFDEVRVIDGRLDGLTAVLISFSFLLTRSLDLLLLCRGTLIEELLFLFDERLEVYIAHFQMAGGVFFQYFNKLSKFIPYGLAKTQYFSLLIFIVH